MDAGQRSRRERRNSDQPKEAREQSRLQEKSYAKARSGFLESTCCTVCLDVLSAPMRLTCGHVFCGNCLGRWTKRQRNCPTCRECIAHVEPDFNLQTILDKLCPVLLEASEIRDWEIRNARWARKKEGLLSMWNSLGQLFPEVVVSDSDVGPNETSSGIVGMESDSISQSIDDDYETSSSDQYGSRERSRSPTRRSARLSHNPTQHNEVSFMGVFSHAGGQYVRDLLSDLGQISAQWYQQLSFPRVRIFQSREATNATEDEANWGTDFPDSSCDDSPIANNTSNASGVIDLLSDHDADVEQSSDSPGLIGRTSPRLSDVTDSPLSSLSEVVSESRRTSPSNRTDNECSSLLYTTELDESSTDDTEIESS